MNLKTNNRGKKKVVIDTNILGIACSNKKPANEFACAALATLFLNCDVIIPEIVFTELEDLKRKKKDDINRNFADSLLGALRKMHLYPTPIPNTKAEQDAITSMQKIVMPKIDPEKYTGNVERITNFPQPWGSNTAGLENTLVHDYQIALVAKQVGADYLISADQDMTIILTEIASETKTKKIEDFNPDKIAKERILPKGTTSAEVLKDEVNKAVEPSAEKFEQLLMQPTPPLAKDTADSHFGLANIVEKALLKSKLTSANYSDEDQKELQGIVENLIDGSTHFEYLYSRNRRNITIGDMELITPSTYNATWSIKQAGQAEMQVDPYMLLSATHAHLRELKIALPELPTQAQYKATLKERKNNFAVTEFITEVLTEQSAEKGSPGINSQIDKAIKAIDSQEEIKIGKITISPIIPDPSKPIAKIDQTSDTHLCRIDNITIPITKGQLETALITAFFNTIPRETDIIDA